MESLVVLVEIGNRNRVETYQTFDRSVQALDTQGFHGIYIANIKILE
jgi:hypothetical protein